MTIPFWFLVLLMIALLTLIAWLIGKATQYNGLCAILIDNRGRYSLTHFQVVVWTFTIMATFLSVLILNKFNPDLISIPPELLGLMGVSASSAILATGVKAVKDASGASIARDGTIITTKAGEKITIAPHFAQIWLEEEGDLADQTINITKFQNFIFTIVALFAFIALAFKASALPTLPESVVWLLGISHAGYTGGKIPDKK